MKPRSGFPSLSFGFGGSRSSSSSSSSSKEPPSPTQTHHSGASKNPERVLLEGYFLSLQALAFPRAEEFLMKFSNQAKPKRGVPASKSLSILRQLIQPLLLLRECEASYYYCL